MPQGSFGRVRAWNDFTAIPPIDAADTVPLANGSLLGGGWAYHAANEGTIVATVNEPNGVIGITTDTGDNDNGFISAGTWAPINGGMVMESRIKIVDSMARAACWVGFTETLAVGTPVMPAETSGTTTTYNGSGGMAGFIYDPDSSTNLWRFVVGDASAALATKDKNGSAGTALGVNAEATLTADRWWVLRVEVGTNGLVRGYIGDAQNDEKGALRFVGESTAALGTSDNFHATTGIENRTAANEILEVDYVFAEGWRDWDAD
tara:strand:- start:63 stop:851 length:789 start_codon:yes stop_codon:yes gene_type:complete